MINWALSAARSASLWRDWKRFQCPWR